MRVLVTGATGFLGSHVARRMVERGDEVRVLVRETSDRSRLRGLIVETATGDVTDEGSVVAAVDGVDLVVHCAGVVEFGPRDPSFLDRVNVGGAEHVLGAAARRSVPAVHVSSLAALGPTVPAAPPKDETWWSDGPLSCHYDVTKRRAHEVARRLAAGGADIRIAMPGGIYGPGDQSTMYDLIALYVRWPLPLGYLPDVRTSVVNVDDCADAVLRIADAPAPAAPADGEYIVAAQVVTIAEWVRIIARAGGHRGPVVDLPTRWVRALGRPGGRVASWFGQSPDMVRETVAAATKDTAFAADRLRAELGWRPRSLEAGMAEMAEHLRRPA